MKNIKKAFLGLGVSILIASCGRMEAPMDKTININSGNRLTAEAVPNQQRSYGDSNPEDFNKEMQAFANRKLIRNGNVKFQTKDMNATEAQIKWTVQKLGGFISFEQQTRNEWSVRTDIEIRMPGSMFEEMLDSVCSGAYKIDEKNIKVKDVTDQYVDTEARIATRKLVEQKYVEHLAKSNNIDDVLRIESKIGLIREEIESAEKRLRKLQDQVALSTLHVEFYQQIQKPVIAEKNRFEQAVVNGWNGLEVFLVVLTNIWPVLLGTVVLLFVLRRRIARNDESV